MKYAILIIIVLAAILMNEPERDYTNLTVVPDIAINFQDEYIKKPVVITKWKLSKKRLTKKEARQ